MPSASTSVTSNPLSSNSLTPAPGAPMLVAGRLPTAWGLFLTLASLVTLFALILTIIWIAGYSDDLAGFAARRYSRAGKTKDKPDVVQDVKGGKGESVSHR